MTRSQTPVPPPAPDVTVAELIEDPYPVYRRLRDTGACVWLAPANRYVVPRWDDVFALDENPALTAAEPDSLMTRAMGLSMLRTDGETHQRQRAPAHTASCPRARSPRTRSAPTSSCSSPAVSTSPVMSSAPRPGRCCATPSRSGSSQ